VADLILASASRSRQDLLRGAGIDFQVVPADLDEDGLTRLMPEADGETLGLALAEAKALAVCRAAPGRWVLGGDSVLQFGDERIGKCPDLPSLRRLLGRLCGQSHVLISAAVLARDGKPVFRHAQRAVLTMRNFSENFLDRYLAAEGETLLSCVGGYRYEGLGAQLFSKVEGDYFTILGLPLLPVLAALRAQGILVS
jgi:septum formation protein